MFVAMSLFVCINLEHLGISFKNMLSQICCHFTVQGGPGPHCWLQHTGPVHRQALRPVCRGEVQEGEEGAEGEKGGGGGQ